MEWPRRPAREQAANIVRKNRPGAHGVNPRFRQLSRRKRDDIAGREHVPASRCAQIRLDAKETALVERKSRACKPGRWSRLGGPQHLIDVDWHATFQNETTGFDSRDRRSCHNGNTTRRENVAEGGAKGLRKCRQDIRRVCDEHECEPVRTKSCRGGVPAQPARDGKQKLDAACSRAHDRGGGTAFLLHYARLEG